MVIETIMDNVDGVNEWRKVFFEAIVTLVRHGMDTIREKTNQIPTAYILEPNVPGVKEVVNKEVLVGFTTDFLRMDIVLCIKQIIKNITLYESIVTFYEKMGYDNDCFRKHLFEQMFKEEIYTPGYQAEVAKEVFTQMVGSDFDRILLKIHHVLIETYILGENGPLRGPVYVPIT